jgi:iron-sulfur cluster assembly protein
MITLTERAGDKIVSNIKKRGRGQGIKVGVKTTGCSGLAYVLEYVDEAPCTWDWVEIDVKDGAKIWINEKDRVYLAGLVIDYVKRGLNEGFDFINPNESARCGCGESFTV